ncbi:MAG: hypothetical protein K8R54_00485 [Bacteroidales bacterium]|nr:hypothetical protein [Bacteroidales bacterium]
MKTALKFILTISISILVSFSFAQDNKFDIGLRTGVFVPSNWMIQGYQTINYVDGSPTSIFVTGFGNGTIFNLYAKYFITDYTGIMIEGGANLLHGNKLDLALAPDGDSDIYENSLTIFPINLCLIHKCKFTNTKFSPFTGLGFGIYISEWVQKHYPANSDGTCLQGKENPLGLKFFTTMILFLIFSLIIIMLQQIGQ